MLTNRYESETARLNRETRLLDRMTTALVVIFGIVLCVAASLLAAG